LRTISVHARDIFSAAAQVQLGFQENDRSATEGADGSFTLRRQTGILSNDAVLRLIPLTVSGFQDYRIANPNRTFDQDILNAIAAIANPAECEY